jgi:hypothetical protein
MQFIMCLVKKLNETTYNLIRITIDNNIQLMSYKIKI